MHRGVRFPNPPVHTQPSEQVRTFLEEGVRYCLNPWPQMVDADTAEFGWSHPILRLLYLPSTAPELDIQGTRDTTTSLQEALTILHEAAHLCLDFTPAKEIIRLLLAFTYTGLLKMSELPKDGETPQFQQNWTSFKLANDKLAEVVYLITLPEELLATAWAFAVAERLLPGRLDDLSLLEKQWVEAQDITLNEAGINEFSDLYPGFKKASILFRALSKPAPALAIFGSFIEPARIKTHLDDMGSTTLEFAVANIKTRCKYLSYHATLIDDAEDLLDTLNAELISRGDMDAWHEILTAGDNLRREHPSVRVLWEMTGMPRVPDDEHSPEEVALNILFDLFNNPDSMTSDSLRLTYIYPKPGRDRWYIHTEAHRRGTLQSAGDTMRALFLESLRQQLDSRTGFSCPFFSLNLGSACGCTDEHALRQRLLRLSELAHNGVFGEGNWVPLPDCCNHSRQLWAEFKGLRERNLADNASMSCACSALTWKLRTNYSISYGKCINVVVNRYPSQIPHDSE